MTLDKEETSTSKVAIITGANAGVGYGICQRLLELEGDSMTIVMACRSQTRASNARQKLLAQFPYATIDIILVDIGDVLSVLEFCHQIREKYNHVNYLFCNAGILSALGIKWSRLFFYFLKDPVGLMERSDATIQAMGELNPDGMGRVFACNVFGHYVMMRELEQLLSNSGDGRVIWTSSITAEKASFDIEDWQGLKSLVPYEASKWACDLVAIATNDRFIQEGLNVVSFTTSPGVVASNIGSLPTWIIKARTLIHYLFRLCGVTSQNITGYNGAIADVFVALQPLAAVNYWFRYCSLSNRWGKAYVEAQALEEYDPEIAEKLLQKCELAYQAWKKNPKKKMEEAQEHEAHQADSENLPLLS
ncbi:uncharacterized protein BYT42DRAFT_551563 [Radiomyces spectabilis]|uniref:uncharacterized protein n=1 Tax=Radiomyces spectabilis TaxID=64574 RepID=UPI00221EE1BE|nr:uncharacterized protein BYT42DRAFT_551563 [Radiomyces spectabilis]KAI8393584.1 hypothetical protein BYT42DRAFT_551563 [Radiomyces spectabilis]